MPYTIHRLLKAPSFAALATVTIACAVGVNVGLLSVTETVVAKVLGVPEAKQLVSFSISSGAHSILFSGPAYEALHNAGFNDLAIWRRAPLIVQTPDGAARLSGALVNGQFFSVMKLRPILGRALNNGDDRVGGGTGGWAGVLCYGYWKTHYNADPRVIGKSAVINGAVVRIVGVLPEEFSGLNPPAETEILLPRHFLSVISPTQDRFSLAWYMEWEVFGRLPRGTTLASLESRLHVIELAFRKAADPTGGMFDALLPGSGSGALLSVRSGQYGASHEREAIRAPLRVMQGLAGVLFLLCTCNLILLFAGRIGRQAYESAIRTALGARRKHLIAIPLIDALVLGVIGSIAAIPIAIGMAHVLSLLVRSTPGFQAFPMALPPNLMLLQGFGAGMAMAVLVAAGTALWQIGRQPVLTSRTAKLITRDRFKPWIITAEVTSAILLLAVAATSAIGLNQLLRQPSGFAEADVTATVSMSDTTQTPQQAGSKTSRLIDSIVHAPGVESVATVNVAPLLGLNARATFAVRRKNGAFFSNGEMWPAIVSLRYFTASDTRVLKGRDFVRADLTGDPVCLISQSAAQSLYGLESPLETHIYSGGGDSQNPPAPYCRVIGTVEDAHLKSMSEPPEEVIYRLTNEDMENIIVRASSTVLATQAIRNAVRSIAPTSLISGLSSIAGRIKQDLRVVRLLSLFSALCAFITSLIMAIGIFGVLAIEVSARKREIGIQISLGAGKLAVFKAVLRRFGPAIMMGLGIGLAGSIIVATKIAGQYALNIAIPLEAVAATLLAGLLVVFVAVIFPVGRALAVSPVECLRSE